MVRSSNNWPIFVHPSRSVRSAALSQFQTTPSFSSRLLVRGESERRPLSFASGFHSFYCLCLCGSWQGLALSTVGLRCQFLLCYWRSTLETHPTSMGGVRHRDTATHPTDYRVARETLALSAPSSACKPTPAAAAETRHRALRRRLLALRPQEEDIRRSITTLTPPTTRASIRSGPQPLGKAPPLPRRACGSTSLSLRRWKERGHKPH
jgi:hypothetical protein